ncbi:DUF4241 domain-containing protein [Nonomuraea rhodomycinica]|uniref:DUF4241 domain-containing protein n=1 Tax=Nonomuraea rhodomycinica TaxID=1712872 RepID=A0A7Y6MFA0_9ACTN|nr:DUF4241 domain-containing protein [Nonomuraea rhodomycinica]NUW45767.1 DUF4241 domain-containing protein [Nonomuraea rhodomycinica]
MPISPADFDAIFTEGARFPWPSGHTLRIELREVAKLELPTGRLVARDNGIRVADPFDETQAFAHSVKNGSYTVVLAIAEPEARSYGARPRAAAAKVVISAEEVASWEIALRPGQRMADLADDAFFGFAVDSGQGCFLDLSTLPFLRRLQRDETELDAARDRVMRDCHAELMDPQAGTNIVLFDCGMGDGAYPTWLGRGVSGEIVCFATDLELLSHSSGRPPT